VTGLTILAIGGWVLYGVVKKCWRKRKEQVDKVKNVPEPDLRGPSYEKIKDEV